MLVADRVRLRGRAGGPSPHPGGAASATMLRGAAGVCTVALASTEDDVPLGTLIHVHEVATLRATVGSAP
ncbi:MAG: hypothetical protein R3F59_07960 [Myxococcota bacterium]